jgi:hypothetical protein
VSTMRPVTHCSSDSYESDYPAQDETVESPKVQKRRSKRGYAKYDKMGLEDLLKQNIETLRLYANKGLQIVGASKIPGGKVALVSRILEVRE